MQLDKFNLYNAEWLDLVFDHRNKEYGAYELRAHYGRNMARAMGLTFAGLSVLIAASIIFKPAPVEVFRIIPVDLSSTKIIQPVNAEIKKPADPIKVVAPVKPAAPVHSMQNLPPVVVPADPPVEPHTTAQLQQTVISNVDTKGSTGTSNLLEAGKGDGEGAAAGKGTGKPDETIYETGGLEAMPEPIGGASAWGKFLQKNLRFPAVAQEQGISGRVIMSFVIEKDGQLSNIKVERGAGYGFDEEAIRVLKLAKAWKPGKQNGQPVRVKYVIPMNFQLSSE